MLQKEVNILKKQGYILDVKITPFDIIYGSKSGKDFSNYATHLAFTHLDVEPTKGDISEIDKLFEQSEVGGSFNDLPFGNESFDGILASYSFGIHSQDKEQILKAYNEVQRVLKKNGQALVSVIYDSDKNVFRTMNKINPVEYSLEDISLPSVDIKLIRSPLKIGQDLVANDFLEIEKTGE